MTIPAGWRLVPEQMDDEMAISFTEAWFSKVRPIDDPGFDDAYAALLAAAPSPPSGWMGIDGEAVEWQFRTVPSNPPAGMDVDKWYPWVSADDEDHWKAMQKMFADNPNAQFRALAVIPSTEDRANG